MGTTQASSLTLLSQDAGQIEAGLAQLPVL